MRRKKREGKQDVVGRDSREGKDAEETERSRHRGERFLLHVLGVVHVSVLDKVPLADVQPSHQASAKPDETVQGRGEDEKYETCERSEVRLPALDGLRRTEQGRGGQA